MTGHGVGVAVVGGCILLQCECGWRRMLAEVTTADAITESVARHRQESSNGEHSG